MDHFEGGALIHWRWASVTSCVRALLRRKIALEKGALLWLLFCIFLSHVYSLGPWDVEVARQRFHRLGLVGQFVMDSTRQPVQLNRV